MINLIIGFILYLGSLVGAVPPEPYGGCDEAWQEPDSAGAAWCRWLEADAVGKAAQSQW